MNEKRQEEKKKEEERKKNSTGKKEEMKGKSRKEIIIRQEDKTKKKKKQNEKKNESKKRLLGFEPETSRLALCSLNNNATQHNTSHQMHVIVSYLKVICNLQAGSRDKQFFKGRFPLP